MKKIVASVSLVALGTAGLHANPTTSADSSRPWSVAATLSGFYDDNVNSVSSSANLLGYHRASAGFAVSPSISFTWPWEQTTISANYMYTFKDYDNKPIGNTENFDQNHTFNVALDHSFNENYQINAHDSFVIGQEPDFLRSGNTFSTFQRTSGNNLRNAAAATLNGRLTPLLGFELGYANSLYHYADDANDFANLGPSTAALLDRFDQVVHLDSVWQVQPETKAIVGYQFADSDYTAGQQIATDANGNSLNSDGRNSRSHYGYLGFDHQFQPDLSGAIRLGARYTDYYNDPSESTSLSPYVQLSLRYSYAPQCFIEGGFVQDRSATSLVGSGATGLTVDAETSNLYVNITHRLAHNLFGSIVGEFQNSDYNGGDYNGLSEQFYTLGVNLKYDFSRNFSGNIGYNYDKLESVNQIQNNRSFDRNRVYLGITATY